MYPMPVSSYRKRVCTLSQTLPAEDGYEKSSNAYDTLIFFIRTRVWTLCLLPPAHDAATIPAGPVERAVRPVGPFECVCVCVCV